MEQPEIWSWKVISEFPRYEMDKYGRVRNRKSKRILKTLMNQKGYAYVVLSDGEGNHTSRSILKLMSIMFPDDEEWEYGYVDM